MSSQKKNAGKLSGVQTEERTISALPIRIDYQRALQEYTCKAVGDDFRFSPVRTRSPLDPLNHTSPMELARMAAEQTRELMQTGGFNLDPYAVREAFFAASDIESVLRFLNNAGIFWRFEDILWSQFKEWQRYFRWLRMDPEKALLKPEGAKAWRTAAGYENLFFAEMPSRFPPEAREEIGADGMREIEVEDRQMLEELRRFALTPERLHGHSISLQWHGRTDKTYAPRVPLKRWKGVEHKPFLLIEADCAAEAVAATIYADRVHGVVYEACKHCGKLFEVKSEHGQEFCPRPDWLKKSPCANAYQSQVNRNREREKRQKGAARRG